MDTERLQTAASALKALPPGSMTAQVRKLLPVIEGVLADGVRHEAVLRALNEAGLEMSPATYKGILQRLRREARQGATAGRSARRGARSEPAAPLVDQGAPQGPADPDQDALGTEDAEGNRTGSEHPGYTPSSGRAEREKRAAQFIPDIPKNRFAEMIKKDQR